MSQRLTPVDILNLRFKRSPVGYAIPEVDDFVRRVAEDMETLLTEAAVQREKQQSQESELAQYRAIEMTLRDALVLAQKAADETRASARMHSEALVQDAQARAHDIEARMQEQLAELKNSVERLRQERRRLARDLRSQLTAQLAWLAEEFEAESSGQDKDEVLTAKPGNVVSKSLLAHGSEAAVVTSENA